VNPRGRREARGASSGRGAARRRWWALADSNDRTGPDRTGPAAGDTDTRSLWIQQVNAATREHDLSYSRFVHGLQNSNVELNRKVLAELAITEPFSFAAVVELCKRG